MILRYCGVLQYMTAISRDDIMGSHKVVGIIPLDTRQKYTLERVNAWST
jgi:hypothetical protein